MLLLGVHTCALCRKADRETEPCSAAACGRFYHRSCALRIKTTQLQKDRLYCPLHTCATCFAEADEDDVDGLRRQAVRGTMALVKRATWVILVLHWPWIGSNPHGHIGPHSTLLLSIEGLSLPAWVPICVDLSWPCLSSISSADVVISWIPAPPSRVLVVCAGDTSISHDQVCAVVFLVSVCFILHSPVLALTSSVYVYTVSFQETPNMNYIANRDAQCRALSSVLLLKPYYQVVNIIVD